MKFLFALGLLSAAVFAADSKVTVWRSSDLNAKAKALAPKATPQQMSTEQLGAWGNHTAMLGYRKANGEPEQHDNWNDFFVVRTGEATLLVGGKIAGGKTTAPGETRGGRIEGGEKQKLAPGDIVHIPAGVPHQLLLDGGKDFVYFTIKVEKP